MIEKINQAAIIATGPGSKAATLLARCAELEVRPSQWIIICTAVILFGYAGSLFWNWIQLIGNWYNFRAIVSLIITATFILLYNKVVNYEEIISDVDNGIPRSDVSVRILGFDLNFLVMQLACVIVMLYFVIKFDFENVKLFSWLGIILMLPLWSTRRRTTSIAFGLTCVFFLMLSWLLEMADAGWYHYTSRNAEFSKLFIWLISPKPYLIAFISLALVPQIQAIRIGGFGLGRLKGDLHLRLLGSIVPICFTSSIVIVSIISAIIKLFALPAWLISIM